MLSYHPHGKPRRRHIMPKYECSTGKSYRKKVCSKHSIREDRLENAILTALQRQEANNFIQRWKANARGVDLNRNFDIGWASYIGAPAPYGEGYKGPSPASEPETQARDLKTLKKDYKVEAIQPVDMFPFTEKCETVVLLTRKE